LRYVARAATKIRRVKILGDPMDRLRPWATLMVIFDVLHWSLGGLFFGRILED